jgi:hypothetical protein
MRANHTHAKRVYQYELDRLTLISQFDSIRQAAELTGISRKYLRCLNQATLAHGSGSSVSLLLILIRTILLTYGKHDLFVLPLVLKRPPPVGTYGPWSGGPRVVPRPR